jgi:hypothetical protein
MRENRRRARTIKVKAANATAIPTTTGPWEPLSPAMARRISKKLHKKERK